MVCGRRPGRRSERIKEAGRKTGVGDPRGAGRVGAHDWATLFDSRFRPMLSSPAGGRRAPRRGPHDGSHPAKGSAATRTHRHPGPVTAFLMMTPPSLSSRQLREDPASDGLWGGAPRGCPAGAVSSLPRGGPLCWPVRTHDLRPSPAPLSVRDGPTALKLKRRLKNKVQGAEAT